MADNIDNRKLAAWIGHIRKKDMPVFDNTVRQIAELATNKHTKANELASIILQDPSLTSRLLKLANSPYYYNPRGQRITTVSRAIVVLGFENVYNICLSLTLVDSMIHGEPREQLVRELARSIHAAVQAQDVARERGDEAPEEVFVATLLYRVGELAFWCFGGKDRDGLRAMMQHPGLSRDEAEEKVLGFRLSDLTLGLAKEWRLTPLLIDTLTDPKRAGPRGRNVALARQVATAAEQSWTSGETTEGIKELAAMVGQPAGQMVKRVHENARRAVKVAALYGARIAAETIPAPSASASLEPDESEEEEEEETIGQEAFPEPNSLLQLRILRELSVLLEGSADSNLVMELILEGIYRGIGMDRTLFSLLTPDRRGVRAKYAMGPRYQRLLARFHFNRLPDRRNVLFHTMDTKDMFWVDTDRFPELAPMVQPNLVDVVGEQPFFVGPIVVNGISIGLFYADRAASGRPLDEEAYESFKHFVRQANVCLTHLAVRKR